MFIGNDSINLRSHKAICKIICMQERLWEERIDQSEFFISHGNGGFCEKTRISVQMEQEKNVCMTVVENGWEYLSKWYKEKSQMDSVWNILH